MSLINEALKKVSRERGRPEESFSAGVEHPATPKASEKATGLEPAGQGMHMRARSSRAGRPVAWFFVGTFGILLAAAGLRAPEVLSAFFGGPLGFPYTFGDVLPAEAVLSSSEPLTASQLALWGQAPAGLFLRKPLLSAGLEAADLPVFHGLPRPQLRLTGTVAGAVEPSALINNRWLTIGEEIQGARVRDIREGEAVLEYHGKEIHLSVI